MDADDPRWADAALAAALLAVDPLGLGGACVRAGHGPARDAWLALLRAALPAGEPMRRVPAHIAEDRLLGGLDLAATLRASRPVAQRGLLAEADGGFVVLPMVERFPPATLAHLTAVLDTGVVALERHGLASRTPARLGVIALDESNDDEEHAPPELLDRLAFLLDFSGLRAPSAPDGIGDAAAIAQARARLPQVRADDAIVEALCATAMRLGIASLRPSLLALRAARALAALSGSTQVDEEDAIMAARLVLAPRATVLPEAPAESDSTPEDEPAPQDSASPPPEKDADAEEPDDNGNTETSDTPPEDLVLAAAVAAIPAGLLERLRRDARNPVRGRSLGRAGALRQSLLRGRPAGVRRGDPRAGVRLNLIETLRAAAPWQALRRREAAARGARRVEIRREDFHITRYRQRTQTTTIFVVDASGSSALNRLAEAKGAVELLLADCYVRRDQVAVIAFRGRGAELLLPPTRSLLRAKRQLAGMPGGSGTPLAAGIDAGLALAEQVRRGGQTPTLVLLTDGQAHIARDGSGGRERAGADARAAARRLREAGLHVVFIDISPRPQPLAAELAALMGARYLPLPYADARTLSRTIQGLVPGAPRPAPFVANA